MGLEEERPRTRDARGRIRGTNGYGYGDYFRAIRSVQVQVGGGAGCAGIVRSGSVWSGWGVARDEGGG